MITGSGSSCFSVTQNFTRGQRACTEATPLGLPRGLPNVGEMKVKVLARIRYGTPERDRGDSRATGQQSRGTARSALEAYLVSTSLGSPRPARETRDERDERDPGTRRRTAIAAIAAGGSQKLGARKVDSRCRR